LLRPVSGRFLPPLLGPVTSRLLLGHGAQPTWRALLLVNVVTLLAGHPRLLLGKGARRLGPNARPLGIRLVVRGSRQTLLISQLPR